MSGFQAEFKRRLVDEFGCREENASQIAMKADQFRADHGDSRSPDQWIEQMRKPEYESCISRWNQSVGYSDLDDWGADNLYQL